MDLTGGWEKTVDCVDGAVDNFVIKDDASAVLLSIPTKDKTTKSLTSELKKYQAKSGIKILKILTDNPLAKDALEEWSTEDGIDLCASPPLEAASNSRAESGVNLCKTKGRTLRQASGAGAPLVSLAMQWAAMASNFVETDADPLKEHRRPVDIWPDLPHRHKDLCYDISFGCRAFRHEGKTTERPHMHRRARPAIFVGWSRTSPSYLLYDLDTHKIYEGSYVTFDERNFPLLSMLLAGEISTADRAIDIDGWRVCANNTIEDADDAALANWCVGKQILLDMPSDYYPHDAPHIWTMRCT